MFGLYSVVVGRRSTTIIMVVDPSSLYVPDGARGGPAVRDQEPFDKLLFNR